MKDHLEAAGHKDALVYMRKLARQTDPLREGDIRNLHRLVMQKYRPKKLVDTANTSA